MRNSEGDFNKVQMLSGDQGLNKGILNGKEEDMRTLKCNKTKKIALELKCYETAGEYEKGLGRHHYIE